MPDRLLTVASLGYDGRVRLGAWMPVWIDLAVPSGGVDGMLQIDTSGLSGQAGTSFAVSVRAAPGARLRVFAPVIFYDARSPGTAVLRDRLGQQVASLALPRLQPADEIVAVLSAEPLGIEGVAVRTSGLGVAYIEPEALPTVWQAYQAVRLLVVRDLDERRVTDQQRRAIQQWVWSGGRLLAIPSGDDVRHLRGPTLGPLLEREAGGLGLGRATVWSYDAALPEHRGRAVQERGWEQVMVGDLPAVAPGLEATVPPDRGVPQHAQAAIVMLVLTYMLVVRSLSRFLAGLRPARVIAAVLALALATGVAVQTAALARRAASGVLASSVIEGLPGTGYGLLAVAARTVHADDEGVAVVTGRNLLLRPSVPARVRVVHFDGTSIASSAGGALLTGTGIVPLPITGTYAAMPGGAEVNVANRSGHRLEPAWVYAAGRVQAIPAVGPALRVALDDRKWQVPGRLQRADPNPALQAWAFARLEAGAILRGEPAWLLGWIRDPAGGLHWGNRPEPSLHLVLVPLTAP